LGPDGLDSPSAHEPGDYYNQSRKPGDIGSSHLPTAYCFFIFPFETNSSCIKMSLHSMTSRVMSSFALSQAA
jgi:hypothetical protein